ncbi:thioredoxin domain-containing protein [Bradyrhizobium sp. LHD-71]|uniref:thioredoxin domain-containing protein n=1 Tax=Bradyrhizobium sp. LHD-71 TaxID=3072141 RepID=UPI00280D4ADE|nr:thioredoxin domain-containing protein [Bradyrhizobium sp. LHD-71]MDQ8732642.1 thioredoxin domain-containing protein [Bradyrhizobium sp. LHD-71]
MAKATAHTNRLATETSPYLLQHQHNPVDWWPWGPAALDEARRTNRPILLSIGYAACHWCHVMAHESFEDAATAKVMNELFVNIKVDREERPDVDQIYMSALHHLGEQGGWPLTMFLNPDSEPFWGGTYFPKAAQFGRAAFVDVLHEVNRVFHAEPARIDQNRRALVARLKQRGEAKSAVTIGPGELNNIAESIARATDPVHGGLRGAPKFPQCTMLEFIWRAGARAGDARFFKTTELALTQMSQGGIYDHLGGGYARYSVDERWLVPHFEKMLYDNAQILDLLALDYAQTKNPLYRERAIETVGWLRREMKTAEGAFASSLDADSEGEEGKFYVWSAAEIQEALGPEDAALFATKYDISSAGNFEGHNIPNRLAHPDDTPEETAKLAVLRQMLLQRRSTRIRPGLDDKILADWNGLMIAALANAAVAFDQPDWLSDAKTGFNFVARSMTRGDRIGHSWRAGSLLLPGLASDYAAMIRAGLALYEATGEATWLSHAVKWQRTLDAHHADNTHGGYFLTADDAEGLIIRPHSTVDDAIPNHNGLIAQNLIRLAVLTGDDSWRAKADAMFDAILPRATDHLFGHLSLLNALDMRLTSSEVVVVGQGAQAEALLRTARSLPHASRIVLHASDGTGLADDHPAKAKLSTVSEAAAFVCRGQVCSLPVTDPADLATIALPAGS